MSSQSSHRSDRKEGDIMIIGRHGTTITKVKRKCMCCGVMFFSEHKGNRMCLQCKHHKTGGFDNWGR